jgi:hypothetical protein
MYTNAEQGRVGFPCKVDRGNRVGYQKYRSHDAKVNEVCIVNEGENLKISG